MKISEIFKNNVKEAELLETQNPSVQDRVTRVEDKKALEEVANRDPAMEQLTSKFGVVPARNSQLRTLLNQVNQEPLRTLDSDEDIAKAPIIQRSPKSIGEIVTPDEVTAINSCSCDRVMNAVPSESLLQAIRNTPAAHFDSGAVTLVTGPNGSFKSDYTEEALKKAHEKAGTEYDRKNYPTRSELVHRHILDTLDAADKTLQEDPTNTECQRIMDEFMHGSSSLAGVPPEGGTKQLSHNFVSHYLSHVQKAGLEPSDVGITPEELARFDFTSDFLTGKAKEQAATRAEQSAALPSAEDKKAEEAYRDTRLEKPGECKVCEQYRQGYNNRLLKLKDNIYQRILSSGKPYSPEYADSTAAELAHHVHNLWTGKTPNDSLENELFANHAKEIEGMHDVLADWDDHRDSDHNGATEQAINLDIPINYSKPESKKREIINADTGEAYEPDVERNPDVDKIYKNLEGVTERWDMRARTDIHTGEDPFLDEEGRPVTQMRGESDESFAIRRQKKANEARLDISVGVRPSTLESSPSIRNRPDYAVIEPPNDMTPEGLREWGERRMRYEQTVPARQISEMQSEPKMRVTVPMPGRNVEGYIEGVDENGKPIPLKGKSSKTSVPNRTERVWTYSAATSDLPNSTVVAPMENFRTDKCRHKDCENPETCSGKHQVTWKVPFLPDTDEVRSLQQRTPGIASKGADETDEEFAGRRDEWRRAESDRYEALRSHMQEKVGVSTENFRSARCEKCGSQLCSGWHKADDQSIMSIPSEHAYLFQTAGMQPDLAKWRKYRDIQTRYMAQQPAELERTTREVQVPRSEMSLSRPQETTDLRSLVGSGDAASHQKRFQEWHDGLDDYGKSLYDEYTKGYARSRAEIEAKLNEAYPWGTEDNPNPDNFANVQNLLKRWDKNWHRKFSREHTHRYFDFDDDKVVTDTKMIPRRWDEVFADYPMKKGVVPTSGPLFKAMNGRGIPMPTRATMPGTETRVEEVRRAVRPTSRIKPPRLGLKLDAMNDYRRSFETALRAVYPGVGREEAIERLKADHAEQAAKASARKTSSIEEGNEMAKYIFNSRNKKEAINADIIGDVLNVGKHLVQPFVDQAHLVGDVLHNINWNSGAGFKMVPTHGFDSLGEWSGMAEKFIPESAREIAKQHADWQGAKQGLGEEAAAAIGFAARPAITKGVNVLIDKLDQRIDNKAELDRRKNLWDAAPGSARSELAGNFGRQVNPYHPSHMDVHAPGSDGPWDRITNVGRPRTPSKISSAPARLSAN